MSFSFSINSIGTKIKSGVKKLGVKAKEGYKSFAENFDSLADPKKTIYKYEKTFFFPINTVLKRNDPEYQSWINFVMRRFAGLGFGIANSDYSDTLNQRKNVNSIVFDLVRSVRYDPNEMSFYRQKLYLSDWAKKSQERWAKDMNEKRKKWQQSEYKDNPIHSKSPRTDPKNLKRLDIEVSLIIGISYSEKSVKVKALIDYKESKIIGMESKLIPNITNMIKHIIEQMKGILYSEIMEEEIEEEIRELYATIDYIEQDNIITDEDLKSLQDEISDDPAIMGDFADNIISLIEEAKEQKDNDKRLKIFEYINKGIKSSEFRNI